MNILSFETTSYNSSISLSKNNKIIDSIDQIDANSQAEKLFIHINNLLTHNNLDYNDLDYVAVNTGPGSFTGVRIGIASARGINVAGKINIIGISTFESIAWQAINKENITTGNILVLIDAKRNQLYYQMLKYDLSPISSPDILNISDIDNLKLENISTICGSGAKFINNNNNLNIIEGDIAVEAKSLAHIAYDKIKSNIKIPPVKPLYIRKPDAKISTKS